MCSPWQLALFDVFIDVVEVVAQQLVNYEESLAEVEDVEQQGQSVTEKKHTYRINPIHTHTHTYIYKYIYIYI